MSPLPPTSTFVPCQSFSDIRYPLVLKKKKSQINLKKNLFLFEAHTFICISFISFVTIKILFTCLHYFNFLVPSFYTQMLAIFSDDFNPWRWLHTSASQFLDYLILNDLFTTALHWPTSSYILGCVITRNRTISEILNHILTITASYHFSSPVKYCCSNNFQLLISFSGAMSTSLFLCPIFSSCLWT
jgi:hypothetical protein